MSQTTDTNPETPEVPEIIEPEGVDPDFTDAMISTPTLSGGDITVRFSFDVSEAMCLTPQEAVIAAAQQLILYGATTKFVTVVDHDAEEQYLVRGNEVYDVGLLDLPEDDPETDEPEEGSDG